MLLYVAAHNVSIGNVKMSKRECHITNSVTKCTASQNVKCTLRKRYKTYMSQRKITKFKNYIRTFADSWRPNIKSVPASQAGTLPIELSRYVHLAQWRMHKT